MPAKGVLGSAVLFVHFIVIGVLYTVVVHFNYKSGHELFCVKSTIKIVPQ